MSFDLRRTREGYRDEYPIFKDLTAKAVALLSATIVERGLRVEVDGRPKDVSSFLRKAIRKHLDDPIGYADPLTRISDKAGIRAVVEHRDDALAVREIVGQVFEALDFEDTATRLKPNELGYLGWHLQARLLDTDLGPNDQHLRHRQFEVQIHTIAQHAWSAVSHPIVYKPLGSDPPAAVASRVFRAVALVSLFDEEIASVRAILRESSDYIPNQMLTELDPLFVNWAQHGTDDQLSRQVLEVVQRAYSRAELDNFPRLIGDFIQHRRADLDVVYGQYGDTGDEYPLLFQPESLAIYERLQNAKARLRSEWVLSPLPVDYLEELASVFAEPY